jgi:hypothetical protein
MLVLAGAPGFLPSLVSSCPAVGIACLVYVVLVNEGVHSRLARRFSCVFGETADGKTAFPTGIGAASGPVAGLGAGGFAVVVFGAGVGAGAAAGAGAGVTATRLCRNDIRISAKARVEFLRRPRRQG